MYTDLSFWISLQRYLLRRIMENVSSSPLVTLSFSCVASIAAVWEDKKCFSYTGIYIMYMR